MQGKCILHGYASDSFKEALEIAKMCRVIMNKEEYEQSLHWREKDLRLAIHWLRTCAKYGIKMSISY